MSTVLLDERLIPMFDAVRGILEREQLLVVPCPPGAAMVERARSIRPELAVLGDGDGDGDLWPVLEELLAQGGPSPPRLLLVASRPIGAEQREALLGAGVSLVEAGAGPEELARALARVMNIPTRVTVRSRVVFEVRGRTVDDDAVHGTMLDISTGGFRLECARRLAVGEELHCFFSLGASTPVIFATARVMRARDLAAGRFECGLEFATMRLDDRRRIAALVLRQSGLLRAAG